MDWDVVMANERTEQVVLGHWDSIKGKMTTYAAQVGTPEYNAHMEVVQVTDAEVKDAILQLACSVCAMMWVVPHSVDFRNGMNTLTSALFMYNQRLIPNSRVVEFCSTFVRDHEQRTGIGAT